MPREALFQDHLKTGLNSHKMVILYKFPDNTKAVRKPYDFIGSFGGRAVSIEAKVTTTEETLPFSPNSKACAICDLQEHQEQSLFSVRRTGAIGYVAFGVYSNINPNHRRAWLMPIQRFKSKSRDRKEVWTIEEVEREMQSYNLQDERVVELIWVPKTGWTLPTDYYLPGY